MANGEARGQGRGRDGSGRDEGREGEVPPTVHKCPTIHLLLATRLVTGFKALFEDV